MYLKRVELHGFKSFADRIEIEFGPGINAIVGPNGSGKSNITDAIRWVLGEQSVRNLRGSKLEDVIFAGSNTKKPMGMAEVSITLDNSDKLLPLDYSEVCFTRRVFRSGESEFFLNKTPCRLKDIQEILMDTGIGKDGYSIIGQGQVDEILTGRSEERRAILEETAGIMKHKARKKEAEKRMEETVGNMVRIDDILAEIQNQLEPLKLQKEKALEYKRLLEQLKQLDINLLLAEISRIEKKASHIKNSIEENQTSLQKIINERALLHQGMMNDSAQLELLEKDYEIYQQKAFDAGTKRKDLEKDLQWTKDEEKRLWLEQQELSGNIENLRRKISEVKNGLGQKIKVLEQKIKDINGLELKITEGEKELVCVDDSIKKKENLIESLKGDVIDLLNFASEKRNMITSLTAMKTNLENRLKQIRKEICLLDESNNKTRAEIENIKGMIENLTLQCEQKQKQIQDTQDYILKLGSTLEEKRVLSIKKGEELSALASRFKALKEVNESFEGYQYGVRNLLSSIKNNKLNGEGLYGALADIISVDRTYEVAIETALGGALQNIVCDTEEHAKRAIEYLKRHDLGRVTFLPLNTIKPRGLDAEEIKILSMKGCIDTADHLTTCGKKFLPVIGHLLGRVIVVDKMDNAIAIARRCRFSLKIVTLDGELFNPGGSITGGSQKKSSLILSRKRELQEFEEKIARSEKDLAIIRQECTRIEGDYQEYLKMVDSCKNAVFNLKSEIAALERELKEKQTVFNEREHKKSQLESEIDDIKTQTVDIDAQIISVQKDIGSIDIKNTSSQSKVKDLQQQLSRDRSKREMLAQRITDLKVQLASHKQEEISLEQNIQNEEENLQTWSRELKVLEDKFEQNERSMSMAKDKVLNYAEQMTNYAELEKDLLTKVDNLKKQRESLKKALEESQAKFNRLEEEQKKLERKLNECIVDETALNMEFNQVRGKLMERYSLTVEQALNFKKEIGSILEMKEKITALQQEIESLGIVNLQAVDDYDNLKSRYDFLKAQRDDLKEAKDKLDSLIKEITKTMEDMFLSSFEKVREEFKKVFTELFGGGKADLIIEGDCSMLEAGIDIIAQPPGKKLQSISLLSGGEKALTAIALLFAILNIKATPFCILDEIEAALDDANIDRFASYLRKVAGHTQFIIITHRKNTMAIADALYGIAMEETAVSKVLTVKLE
ncbi:chromosome segregation protein SMC [Biomaibacter acetigenes]|uniref:chromosome segregation protein SMC n=1 Tax=Biomaibacter acetigenes TaxID=2316383 RepID=UPI0013CEDEEC|nr:chromosome segregation protein SMC [Biomaibacter acetigenes]MDN5312502.1 chromosome segregation protein [Thermoanaerobacteraceae bacterium]